MSLGACEAGLLATENTGILNGGQPNECANE
jgi:hypothetical protein